MAKTNRIINLKRKYSEGFELDEAKAFLNYLHQKLPADIFYRVEQDMGLVYKMGQRSSDGKEYMFVEQVDRRGDFMINSGLIVPCKLGYLLKGNNINPERPWDMTRKQKKVDQPKLLGLGCFLLRAKGMDMPQAELIK